MCEAAATSYRVLAWWDVDMYIGSYKERKLTARPLRDLERVLGHRVHVEGRSRYRQMSDGVWKFEAFNYVDVADAALVTFYTLRQISALSEWIMLGPGGFKTVKSTSDDCDADICALYLANHDRCEEYRYIQSGGVLLSLVETGNEKNNKLYRRFEQYLRKRPVVQLRQEPRSPENFHVALVIQFLCNNRQKLKQDHWPNLIKKYGFSEDDGVDFGPQPKDGEPNQITVTKTLIGLPEHEAVAYCLARTERCRFKLGGSGNQVFQAERFSGHGIFDGMFSISLTRAA